MHQSMVPLQKCLSSQAVKSKGGNHASAALPMKKKYAPPSLTYLEFLRIEDPISARGGSREGLARVDPCAQKQSSPVPRTTPSPWSFAAGSLELSGVWSGFLALFLALGLLLAPRCVHTSAGCRPRGSLRCVVHYPGRHSILLPGQASALGNGRTIAFGRGIAEKYRSSIICR